MIHSSGRFFSSKKYPIPLRDHEINFNHVSENVFFTPPTKNVVNQIEKDSNSDSDLNINLDLNQKIDIDFKNGSPVLVRKKAVFNDQRQENVIKPSFSKISAVLDDAMKELDNLNLNNIETNKAHKKNVEKSQVIKNTPECKKAKINPPPRFIKSPVLPRTPLQNSFRHNFEAFIESNSKSAMNTPKTEKVNKNTFKTLPFTPKLYYTPKNDYLSDSTVPFLSESSHYDDNINEVTNNTLDYDDDASFASSSIHQINPENNSVTDNSKSEEDSNSFSYSYTSLRDRNHYDSSEILNVAPNSQRKFSLRKKVIAKNLPQDFTFSDENESENLSNVISTIQTHESTSNKSNSSKPFQTENININYQIIYEQIPSSKPEKKKSSTLVINAGKFANSFHPIEKTKSSKKINHKFYYSLGENPLSESSSNSNYESDSNFMPESQTYSQLVPSNEDKADLYASASSTSNSSYSKASIKYSKHSTLSKSPKDKSTSKLDNCYNSSSSSSSSHSNINSPHKMKLNSPNSLRISGEVLNEVYNNNSTLEKINNIHNSSINNSENSKVFKESPQENNQTTVNSYNEYSQLTQYKLDDHSISDDNIPHITFSDEPQKQDESASYNSHSFNSGRPSPRNERISDHFEEEEFLLITSSSLIQKNDDDNKSNLENKINQNSLSDNISNSYEEEIIDKKQSNLDNAKNLIKDLIDSDEIKKSKNTSEFLSDNEKHKNSDNENRAIKENYSSNEDKSEQLFENDQNEISENTSIKEYYSSEEEIHNNQNKPLTVKNEKMKFISSLKDEYSTTEEETKGSFQKIESAENNFCESDEETQDKEKIKFPKVDIHENSSINFEEESEQSLITKNKYSINNEEESETVSIQENQKDDSLKDLVKTQKIQNDQKIKANNNEIHFFSFSKEESVSIEPTFDKEDSILEEEEEEESFNSRNFTNQSHENSPVKHKFFDLEEESENSAKSEHSKITTNSYSEHKNYSTSAIHEEKEANSSNLPQTLHIFNDSIDNQEENQANNSITNSSVISFLENQSINADSEVTSAKLLNDVSDKISSLMQKSVEMEEKLQKIEDDSRNSAFSSSNQSNQIQKKTAQDYLDDLFKDIEEEEKEGSYISNTDEITAQSIKDPNYLEVLLKEAEESEKELNNFFNSSSFSQNSSRSILQSYEKIDTGNDKDNKKSNSMNYSNDDDTEILQYISTSKSNLNKNLFSTSDSINKNENSLNNSRDLEGKENKTSKTSIANESLSDTKIQMLSEGSNEEHSEISAPDLSEEMMKEIDLEQNDNEMQIPISHENLPSDIKIESDSTDKNDNNDIIPITQETHPEEEDQEKSSSQTSIFIWERLKDPNSMENMNNSNEYSSKETEEIIDNSSKTEETINNDENISNISSISIDNHTSLSISNNIIELENNTKQIANNDSQNRIITNENLSIRNENNENNNPINPDDDNGPIHNTNELLKQIDYLLEDFSSYSNDTYEVDQSLSNQ